MGTAMLLRLRTLILTTKLVVENLKYMYAVPFNTIEIK